MKKNTKKSKVPNRIKLTKMVTFAPDIIEMVKVYAKQNRRSFSNASEILIIKGLQADAEQKGNTIQR